MKMRFAQKALATAMVVSMLATPLTAFATDSASDSSSSASTTAAAATTTSSSTTSTEATPAATTTSVAAGGNVTVAGVTLNSTAAGVSTVQSVAAVVVTEPAAAVSADLGLASGERAFASSYDITPAKAPAAAACINAAASSQGASVIGMFNLNIGKMTTGGKYVAADGSVRVQTTVAIPAKNVDPSKTYAMVVVSPGGATRIEQDQDTNPRTVTFAANGGLGAYALIAY